MKTLFSNFKKLDFMGQEFSLELNSSRIYQTSKGAFFSLISILSISVIALMFGNELFTRNNPNSSISYDRRKDFKILLNNIAIVFYLADSKGSDIMENSRDYFDIIITEHILNQNGVYTKKISPYKECKEVVFNSTIQKPIKEILNKMNFNTICYNFDKDTYLKNNHPDFDSNSYSLDISFCRPNDINRAQPCLMNEDFYSVLPVIAFQIGSYYEDNLDYNDPVKFYFKSDFVLLSKGVNKKYSIHLSQNTYISDDGWIFENKREIEYVSFNSKEETFIINGDSAEKDSAAEISINAESKSLKTIRNYMKIQDLFARVGGIANSIIIFMKIITYNYLRFIYLMFVKKNTLDYLDDKLNNYEKIGKTYCNNKLLESISSFNAISSTSKNDKNDSESSHKSISKSINPNSNNMSDCNSKLCLSDNTNNNANLINNINSSLGISSLSKFNFISKDLKNMKLSNKHLIASNFDQNKVNHVSLCSKKSNDLSIIRRYSNQNAYIIEDNKKEDNNDDFDLNNLRNDNKRISLSPRHINLDKGIISPKNYSIISKNNYKNNSSINNSQSHSKIEVENHGMLKDNCIDKKENRNIDSKNKNNSVIDVESKNENKLYKPSDKFITYYKLLKLKENNKNIQLINNNTPNILTIRNDKDIIHHSYINYLKSILCYCFYK